MASTPVLRVAITRKSGIRLTLLGATVAHVHCLPLFSTKIDAARVEDEVVHPEDPGPEIVFGDVLKRHKGRAVYHSLLFSLLSECW